MERDHKYEEWELWIDLMGGRYTIQEIIKLVEQSGLELWPEVEARINRTLEPKAGGMLHDKLLEISRLSRIFPKVLDLECLKMQLGPEYPQDSTIAKLVKLTNEDEGMARSFWGLYMFNVDEIDQINRVLHGDRIGSASRFWSNLVYSDNNVIKKITPEAKDKILEWAASLEIRQGKTNNFDRKAELASKLVIASKLIPAFGDFEHLDQVIEFAEKVKARKLSWEDEKQVNKVYRKFWLEGRIKI